MPRYTTKQKAHTTFQNNHILPQHDMKQHSRLHQVGGCFLFIMWKCRNYLYVFNNNIPIILGFVCAIKFKSQSFVEFKRIIFIS